VNWLVGEQVLGHTLGTNENVVCNMNPAVPARPFFTTRCHFLFLLAALAGCLAASAAALADPDAELYWPQWRGPLSTGEAPLADPPLTWSETNNVKWKVMIRGEGDSTPIVWGSRVFLLAAIPTGTNAAAPAEPQAPDGDLPVRRPLPGSRQRQNPLATSRPPRGSARRPPREQHFRFLLAGHGWQTAPGLLWLARAALL